MNKKIYLGDKEIKNIQLNILLSFKNFCEKNNLKFYLCGGSLLGAVRHQGFIPWDDDIDVAMLRADFEKLVALMKTNKIEKNIDFESYEFNKSVYPFGKLYRNDTFTDCSDNPFGKGIWIDIFPLDKLPKDDKVFKKSRFNIKMLLCKLMVRNNKNNLKFFLKKILKIFLFVVPTLFFTRRLDKLAKKYINISSDYVGCICWGTTNKERTPLKDIVGNKELIFEGYNMPVFSNYDVYLKNKYGNYMILPSINERVSHGYKAWLIK